MQQLFFDLRNGRKIQCRGYNVCVTFRSADHRGSVSKFSKSGLNVKDLKSLRVVDGKSDRPDSLIALLGPATTQAILNLAERLASEASDTPKNNDNPDLVELARKMYRARRERDQIFAPELFCNPAWDILLAAYSLPENETKLTVGKLMQASARPKTTAWRWIERLTEAGLLEACQSKQDRRSSIVALTSAGRNKVGAYLLKLSRHFEVPQLD